MESSERKLRLTLKANAIFSFISGLLLVFLAKPIAQLLHLRQPQILIYIGIGLFLFVFLLWSQAQKRPLSPSGIKLIIFQDWAWVVGSIALLWFDPLNSPTVGKTMVAAVALIVMALALLQAKALGKLPRAK